jgi:hypothetical protein
LAVSSKNLVRREKEGEGGEGEGEFGRREGEVEK